MRPGRCAEDGQPWRPPQPAPFCIGQEKRSACTFRGVSPPSGTAAKGWQERERRDVCAPKHLHLRCRPENTDSFTNTALPEDHCAAGSSWRGPQGSSHACTGPRKLPGPLLCLGDGSAGEWAWAWGGAAHAATRERAPSSSFSFAAFYHSFAVRRSSCPVDRLCSRPPQASSLDLLLIARTPREGTLTARQPPRLSHACTSHACPPWRSRTLACARSPHTRRARPSQPMMSGTTMMRAGRDASRDCTRSALAPTAADAAAPAALPPPPEPGELMATSRGLLTVTGV